MIVSALCGEATSPRRRSLRERIARGARRACVALFAVAGAHAAAASDTGAPLKFEKAFSDTAEPASAHFTATFVSKGSSHQMEVWRDGQHRLKRRTDGAIETFVVRKPASAEFRMIILDTPHKIVTRIDRSNLYRVGNFTDWFDLSHGIRHPKGEYQLVRGVAPAGVPRPLSTCAWYDLTQAQHVVHVCWSTRSRLPMLLVDEHGVVLWQLTQLDHHAIPAATFQVHDEGFVQNDANADMDRD